MVNHYNNLIRCAAIKNNDRILIIVDYKTKKIGEKLHQILKKKKFNTEIVIDEEVTIHGKEPSKMVAKKMLNSNIIFGIRSFSLLHTKARNLASKNGAKFLSLPDYINTINSKSLEIDFLKSGKKSYEIKQILDKSNNIYIFSKGGTNLFASIKNRKANAAPGYCKKKGDVSSPPDIETNIAPIEFSANGKIVIDGSIPHPLLGKLNSKITLEISDGKIKNISGKKSKTLRKIFENNGNKSKILGEIGFGLNKKAKISGNMLEDEGVYGSIHFGFGSNFTFGGNIKTSFHLDMVLKKPYVFLDNYLILKDNHFYI